MKKFDQKKILVISNLDGFANSIRSLEIKKYLEHKGHNVSLLNTLYISRYSHNKKSILNKFPYPALLNLIIYFTELLLLLEKIFINKLNKNLYYYLTLLNMKAKSLLLLKLINSEKYDFVICEDIRDSLFFLKISSYIKILDLPAPLADELYFSNVISKKSLIKYNNLIVKIFNKADYISFHWSNITNYVRNSTYNEKNIFELNWGCNPKEKYDRAIYSNIPKIIFLGSLYGEWVNLPLLSKLSKIYNIDVYGGPPPDKKWGLNYKGYMVPTNTDVLKNYQFGLITISKDKLRRHSSFSAKHLEYLSYGLPVLTPDWRRDPLLEDVSIYYNEDNFLEIIKKYSQKENWQKMSDKCSRKAEEWEWNKVLKPLEDIIRQNLGK